MFEQTGVKAGLSKSVKSLKEAVAAFVDRVADDAQVIKAQADADEIFVEYLKTLNAGQSINIVRQRHKDIEDRRARAAEETAREMAIAETVATVEEYAPPPVIEPAPRAKLGTDPVKTTRFWVRAKISVLMRIKRFLESEECEYGQ